ncbi:hypothetical protein EG329_005889 [Mollisiaceae sp. DMI_Dod_QoI]|nr:hypothetical protein EG329_005889 [Helotiales sp. DMI_Dod_QoI]
MDLPGEIYITSRSRTPSLIDVKSQSEKVFANLPDVIQEAIVSTEFSSQRLSISRVQNGEIDTEFMTQPMFYITSRTDSGIDLPELNVTDEKILSKYGLDLTANFADIRAYGARAFFEKENFSNGSKYSLCACATGYIWVSTTVTHLATDPSDFDDIEIQIGTYALKAKAITTVEIPCRHKLSGREGLFDGQLALLCSTVLGKYLRNRMIGQQYEEATDNAIIQARLYERAFATNIRCLINFEIHDHEKVAVLERIINIAKAIPSATAGHSMLYTIATRFGRPFEWMLHGFNA